LSFSIILLNLDQESSSKTASKRGVADQIAKAIHGESLRVLLLPEVYNSASLMYFRLPPQVGAKHKEITLLNEDVL
jgi:hypothetical protein